MTNNTTATIPGATPAYPANPGYGDALRPWLPLVHRLQGAGKSGGHSVVTVHIVVDEFGKPIHWTEPEVTHIEPCARAEQMTDEEREALLLAKAK